MALGEIKERLKFWRRHSNVIVPSLLRDDGSEKKRPKTSKSLRSRISNHPSLPAIGDIPTSNEANPKIDINIVAEEGETTSPDLNGRGSFVDRDLHPTSSTPPSPTTLGLLAADSNFHKVSFSLDDRRQDSSSTYVAELPTPRSDTQGLKQHLEEHEHEARDEPTNLGTSTPLRLTPTADSKDSRLRPPVELPRRQNLLPRQETNLFKILLQSEYPKNHVAANLDYFGPGTISANMVSRKIWVRRPGASATLVTVHEDDLVDDVRDMILRKYANSLGRSFDAPDVTLRVVPREQRQERVLGPEEQIGQTLDTYFPGGQTVDDALVIDVPLRRTPKASPRPTGAYYDDGRPAEAGTDYFPPMPVAVAPSPGLPDMPAGINGQTVHHPPPHAMSVLTTGHVPALPSPGAQRRHHRERPRMGRHNTNSPTTATAQTPGPSNGTQPMSYASRAVTRSRTHSNAPEKSTAPPVAPPLPTPPPAQPDLQIQRVITPPPRVTSPRPPNRQKKGRKTNADHPTLPAGMLNGAVPPINVLIVEDNIINLKLLEAFMKRLKVRWQTAMNGREAVNKWRNGGFHLVLMDIQLPIMSGLEATKEVRRLERLNSIGVFSSSASSSAPEREQGDEPAGNDILPHLGLFKSPVIIVALTASSLQSDRHEALAVGCNDFLTKPVNFVWLERKVMEWGCMQALIDFDGWRKWKDFNSSASSHAPNAPNPPTNEEGGAAAPDNASKTSLHSTKSISEVASNKAAQEKKAKKKNRSSMGSVGGGTARMSIREENEDRGDIEGAVI